MVEEAASHYVPSLRNVSTPPAFSAEKYIGQLGTNLVFDMGTDTNGQRIYHSPYDVIERLHLKLGDPRVSVVKATFSRLTHFCEIASLADPTHSYPIPGQPFMVSAAIQNQVQIGLQELYARNLRIAVNYPTFAEVFAFQLTAQGQEDLAAKLT